MKEEKKVSKYILDRDLADYVLGYLILDPTDKEYKKRKNEIVKQLSVIILCAFYYHDIEYSHRLSSFIKDYIGLDIRLVVKEVSKC